MTKYTDEQNAVLDKQGNILVAASAGSGKTTVMTERIVRRLAASERIDNVVVLAYNNAAAEEIRIKITGKLYDRVKEETDAAKRCWLLDQIDALSYAHISTIHGFCLNLLRTNFESVGLDPDFTVMSEEETEEYNRRALRETMDGYYAVDDDEYMRLNELLGYVGSEDSLSDKLLKVFTYIDIQPSPEKAIEYLRELAEVEFSKSTAAVALADGYNRRAKEYLNLFESFACYFTDERYPSVKKKLFSCIDIASRLSCAKTFEELVYVVENSKIEGQIRAPKLDIAILTAIKGLCKAFGDFLNKIKDKYQDIATVIKAYGTDKWLTIKFIEVVERFSDNLKRLKSEERKLSFNDLEHYAIKLLSDVSKRSAILARFKLIFVDEYQDVNPAQEQIIRSISGEDNVFLVGDLKQSIYGFRMADSDIYKYRATAYENATEKGSVLRLNDNFRSSKPVLEFVNAVFSRVMTEETCSENYMDNMAKVCRPEYKGEEPSVEVMLVRKPESEKDEFVPDGIYSVRNHFDDEIEEKLTAVEEGRYIAERIRECVSVGMLAEKQSDGSIEMRKLRYSDITVLFRKRKSADLIIKTLIKEGIPVNTSGFVSDNYTKERDVLINLVRVLDNERQDIPFAGYLLSYFGGFSKQVLADIQLKKPSDSLYSAAKAVAESNSPLGKKVAATFKNLSELRKKAAFKNVFYMLTDVITDTGYEAYVLRQQGGRERLSAMQLFMHSIMGADYSVSTRKFVAHFANTTKMPEGSMLLEQGDCVEVRTIHQSKGMEYPVVFLAAADKLFNKEDLKLDVVVDKHIGLGIKSFDEESRVKSSSLSHEAIKLTMAERLMRDELRLLYVALTRAECKLYVTGSCPKDFCSYPRPIFSANSLIDFIWSAAYDNAYLQSIIKYREVTPSAEKGLVNADTPTVVFNKAKEEYVCEYSKIIGYTYKYKEATKIEQKFTVTELSRADVNADSYVSVNIPEDRRAAGIAYHTVMEHIDYSLKSTEKVAREIGAMTAAGILSENEAKEVNPEDIFKCISCDLFKDIPQDKVYRELPFMLNVPANEVTDTDLTDNVLVQGVIDLLILDKTPIIVDFKNSVKNSDELRKKYEKQLYMYKKAVKAAFGVEIANLYLYSFKDGAYIKI